MSESACKSCRAPVLWAFSPAGKPSPIDPSPVAEGNVLLLKPAVLSGSVLAVTLSGGVLEEAQRVGGLRLNHWATCPDKAEWRERQAAKRQREGSDG